MNDKFTAFLAKNEVFRKIYLSPHQIGHYAGKLDRKYQKLLDINDLDERMLMKNRKSYLTPSKYTPFNK